MFSAPTGMVNIDAVAAWLFTKSVGMMNMDTGLRPSR